MDRVKEQAVLAAQWATQATQEAAQQGKAKLDQAQAKRRADAMFRDLGAAVYAERTGRGGTDTADKIERLVTALQQQEAEQGLGDTDGPAAGLTRRSATGGSPAPEAGDPPVAVPGTLLARGATPRNPPGRRWRLAGKPGRPHRAC